MPSSISEYIDKEIPCEELFECMSGSSELDKEVYFTVLKEDNLDIDQIAECVDRERSTVYRSVQRLKKNNFLEQEKISQKGGGYRHVYTSVRPERIAEQMQDMLNTWYAEMGQLIHEFKNKYGE